MANKLLHLYALAAVAAVGAGADVPEVGIHVPLARRVGVINNHKRMLRISNLSKDLFELLLARQVVVVLRDELQLLVGAAEQHQTGGVFPRRG